jgi:hypothetical protein
MTTPAHAAIGYFIAKTFIHAGIIPPSLEPHAITFAMVAANAPDFDGIVIWRVLKHRVGSPLHLPMFWLVMLAPFMLYQTLSGEPKLLGFTLLVFICVLSHFICDTIDYSYGIAWLWPFSNKHYHIWKKYHPVAPNLKIYIRQFRKNPMLIAEMALSLAAYFVYRGGR